VDTYRPQNNRNDRNDHRDSHPAKRHRGPHDRPDRPYRNANGPSRGQGYPRYGGRTWRPFIASERELLKTEHNTGSDVAYFDTAGGVTYRALDELSDSDEAEMDISGDEADSTTEPSNKRARLFVEQTASDNNTPKWSNPDPYTALPPETTPQAKKKDVVQLIRKARVQAKETRSSLPSDTADFISLDFDDSDNSEDLDDQNPEPARAPIPLAASTLPPIPPSNLRLPPKPPGPPPPGPPSPGPPPSGPAKMAKPPVLLPEPTSSALGSRKRTHDDEIKMPHTRLKKATKAPAGGGIIKEWRATPDLVSTPWIQANHSQSANMAVW
jgi:non-canonical poly(A) RNA polymerase PAPD5/7